MVMRIGGLASGMDIESMVKDMMKVQRMKVDRLEQQKTLAQWRQESYNNVNKTFGNFILDTKKEFELTTTTASGMTLNTSVSSLDWVKKASISDEDIAEISARADAAKGTYKVHVDRIASNWSCASSAGISSGDKHNLETQFGLTDPADKIEFTIETTVEGEAKSETFTITYEEASTMNMNDLVKTINGAELGVTAVYDENADRFFFQTDNTGSDNSVKITDNSTISDGRSFITGANSVLKLQYLDSDGNSHVVEDATQGETAEYGGVDAQFDFGAAQDITQSSNEFTMNGINFKLKDTGDFTIDISTNTDGIIDKVKGFVVAYNLMVDEMGTKLSEEKYKDYQPLTQEQREAMSDKDVERWEERAKSGLLRNDSILNGTMQSMRSGLYQGVEGVNGQFSQLTEIGISTQKYVSGAVGGKLQINESKLRKAIEEDPDGVLELLFKQPDDDLKYKSESTMTSEEIREKRSQSGLITRLYDNMITGMKDVVFKAGSGSNSSLYSNVSSSIMIDFVAECSSISMLDKETDDLSKEIYEENRHLIDVENSLWRKFTAMEKALDRMNQQSASLMQQLGMGN